MQTQSSSVLRTNFLEQSVGFVAEFKRVLEQGFFARLNISVEKPESGILTVTIRAEGYIPDRPEDQQRGVLPYADVPEIIEALKEQMGDDPNLNHVFAANTEVKVSPWPLWNQEESEVIGSRGQEIKFLLVYGARSQG